MDAFNLKAILSLDSSGFDSGLDKAGAALGKVGGALKTGFSTIAKVGTVAMGAATAGVIGLTKASVEGYAEFEQLEGGIQTLYGEHSTATAKMMESAKNAWKTAGLSANDYMNTAIESSAAMISSLGGDTDKAAKMMDMSITDMSDNVNKMGTSMESVQNAYRGFSRGNFMMLDNLALGFTGTKDGMQQLLDKAKEYEAEQGRVRDFSIDSYADIVEAIHIVQDNMGIAGTTAKEAKETISGSLSAVKSAWQNLVTGITDPNADLSVLINDMVESASTAMDNLMPAMEQALAGIGKLVENVAPIISEALPSLVEKILPSLLNAATTLLQGLVSALPSFEWVIFDIIREVDVWLEQLIAHVQAFDWVGAATNLMEYITSCFKPDDSALASMAANALTLVESLVQGITKAIPILLPTAMDLIARFGNFLADRAPSLIDTAVDLVLNLAKGLTNPTSLSNMLTSALNLIMKLAEGLINNIPKITATVPQIVDNLVQTIAKFAPRLLVSALQLIIQLEIGLIKNIPTLLAAVPEIISSLVTELINFAGELIRSGAEMIENVKQGFESLDPMEWGKDLVSKFVKGIKDSIGKVKDAVGGLADTVKGYIHFSEPDVGPLADFHTYAPDMMKLFAKGIKDNTNIVANQMEKSFALPDMSNDISGSTNSVTGGNVTINVYGAEGQSEKLLAEEVADLLLHDFNMKQAVWGTT